MKEVMSLELATAEVDKWLDRKKLLPSRRNNARTTIENLAEAVQFGILAIKDDGTIIHTLQDPVTDTNGTPVLTELTYKARISTDEVLKAYGRLKNNTPDAQLIALIELLTGSSFITKLEVGDLSIAKSIGVFFMS